ncbi:MAG TPA: hypothetical protein VJS92_10400 [Candidatus Polarisedimenticolaceae bacterium]|nr:hypothetical protein [Candidatus Polarisedimenticolaceae bacterium]
MERNSEPRDLRQSVAVDALLMRTWSDGEAAVICQLLRCYDIPCRAASDVPHSIFPLTIDGLGELRILVPATRLDEAQRLISAHRRLGLEVLPGGIVA